MSSVRRNLATSTALVVFGLVAGVMITQIGAAAAGTGQQAVPAVNRGAAPLDEVVPQGIFVDVVDATRPALVYIQTEQSVNNEGMNSFFRRFFDDEAPDAPEDDVQFSQGSGFVISPDGYIVTNAHVVSQVISADPNDPAAVETIEADRVTVFLNNDDEYDATIVGIDIGTDLAVLKISAGNLPFIPFGDSDTARVGEWVLAMGAPFGLTRSVTHGIISAKGRAPFTNNNLGSTYQDFIQTDAKINRGNSGGPMVNLRGEVIGINTAIISDSMQGTFAGVGFAIPINLVKGVVDQLIEHGRTIRGWLGISMRPLIEGVAEGYGLDPREVRGAVVISEVNAGEPAEAAGINEGDIVVATGGVRLEDNQDFLQRIAMTPPDASISLDIIRMEPEGVVGLRRSDLSIDVMLGERPPEEEVIASQNASLFGPRFSSQLAAAEASPLQQRLGVTLTEMTASIAEQLEYGADAGGLVVARVDPGGAVVEQQLINQPGTIIREINSRTLTSLDQFDALISEFATGDTVVLTVRYTNGVSARVPLIMPEPR